MVQRQTLEQMSGSIPTGVSEVAGFFQVQLHFSPKPAKSNVARTDMH